MSFVTVEKKGNHAVLSLAREPVNSLNTEVWRQLKAAFDALEADPEVRGVIFASGLSRPVFTAGNDINELYAPRTSLEQYSKFWILSNGFLAQVYSSRLATVSAIKGACPAGGCCLSLCCDLRVMTDFGHIGLNEVALGIPVPVYWARLMAKVVGQAAAEKLCLSATLASPQQALELGLVDQVVSGEELMGAAGKGMKAFLQSPDEGRCLTKAAFRNDFAEEWTAFAKTEPQFAWKALTSTSTVAALEAYMKKLGGRKSKL